MAFAPISGSEWELAQCMTQGSRERMQLSLARMRMPKRRIEEEEAFRRNCPAQAAALAYAHDVDTDFMSLTQDDLNAVDPEVAVLHCKLRELDASIEAAAEAMRAAQVTLDKKRAEYRQLSEVLGPRMVAARKKASVLAARREFVTATQTDTVMPHFIADAPNCALSICGCQIIYHDAHMYGSYLDNSEMSSQTVDAHAPAACYHRLCDYHRDVAPVAADELCRLFCAAMDTAGYPVPTHTTHAFVKK